MASLNRLKSVCHDIGHHAVSGLSVVNPYVLQACKANNLEFIEIDLLDDESYPQNIEMSELLQKSFLALRMRFEEILNTEGFTVQDISTVIMKFRPSPFKDDYCPDCFVTLTHSSGKSFSCGVNCLGQKIG